MSARALSENSSGTLARSLPREILRFRPSERQLHWSIAVPFMVCYTTALILVTVYNPDPTRPYRALVSWIHRLSGVCLFVLPLTAFLRHHRDLFLHFGNLRTAWRWRIDDVKWLLLMGPATLNKRIVLPDQEKFNAGEKINFVFLSATYPIYLVTGLLIWLPGVAYLSWMIHVSMALTATPLMFGHIFMATVNPDTRIGLSGMLSGFVNRHWAEHHYGCWYEETYGHLRRVVQEPAVEASSDPLGDLELPAFAPQKPAAVSWPPFVRPASESRSVAQTS